MREGFFSSMLVGCMMCLQKVWAGQVNCRHRTRVKSVYHSTANIRVSWYWLWCSCSRVHSSAVRHREQTMGTAWVKEASNEHYHQWCQSDTLLMIIKCTFGFICLHLALSLILFSTGIAYLAKQNGCFQQHLCVFVCMYVHYVSKKRLNFETV